MKVVKNQFVIREKDDKKRYVSGTSTNITESLAKARIYETAERATKILKGWNENVIEDGFEAVPVTVTIHLQEAVKKYRFTGVVDGHSDITSKNPDEDKPDRYIDEEDLTKHGIFCDKDDVVTVEIIFEEDSEEVMELVGGGAYERIINIKSMKIIPKTA